jgi:hypothetical protein
MHIKVHWKTFHPICFLNLPPTQNSREALHTARGMYCTIHLLEIIRLSDFSSPLFYPSLLGSQPMSTAVQWSSNKLWRYIHISIFNLWLLVFGWQTAALYELISTHLSTETLLLVDRVWEGGVLISRNSHLQKSTTTKISCCSSRKDGQ